MTSVVPSKAEDSNANFRPFYRRGALRRNQRGLVVIGLISSGANVLSGLVDSVIGLR